MSTFGAPGKITGSTKPIPPERGSFPLDHEGECRKFKQKYLDCLQEFRGQNSQECRKVALEYLECRMQRNLMAPDSYSTLGFGDLTTDLKSPSQSSLANNSQTTN